MRTITTTLALLTLSLSAFAGVPGKWKLAANAPDGNTYNFDLVVKDEAGKLSALLASDRGEMPLQDVALAGDDFSFKLVLDMGPIAFKLKVDGENMKGNATLPDGSNGTVTAKKDGAAAAAPAAAKQDSGSSLAGKWKLSTKTPDGNGMTVTMEITEADGKYSGQVTTENGDVAPVTDIKLEGDVFTFKVPTDEGSWVGSGKLAGKEIKGKVKAPNGTDMGFAATKD